MDRTSLGDDMGKYLESQSGPVQFYCANPQCGKVIEGDELAYESSLKKLTHLGPCQMLLGAHMAMGSNSPVFTDFDIIDRSKALELNRKGEISKNSLEAKSE